MIENIYYYSNYFTTILTIVIQCLFFFKDSYSKVETIMENKYVKGIFISIYAIFALLNIVINFSDIGEDIKNDFTYFKIILSIILAFSIYYKNFYIILACGICTTWIFIKEIKKNNDTQEELL